tara:strand:+ start:1019 stop:1156 length:138 start_codon:yes stop_codon:yes gene_type:complete
MLLFKQQIHMEEDKKTIVTLGIFFALIGVVVLLQIILAIYLQTVN